MTAEIWKPTEGFAGYEVSNLGRVRNVTYPGTRSYRKILNPAMSKQGYLRVFLYCDGQQKWMFVHRLVAKHFLPPTDLPEVNHLDLNKTNNVVSNLEWTTHRGNIVHFYAKRSGVGLPLARLRQLKKTQRLARLASIHSKRARAQVSPEA